MGKITLLVDHQGRFGSKNDSETYRSGMDVSLLKACFRKLGYEAETLHASEVNFRKDWKGSIVLYTSLEDEGYLYKSFLEDIVLGLELAGARVLPGYRHLRAHNNKVIMEILRDLSPMEGIRNIFSRKYGSLEELRQEKQPFSYPVVIKSAAGAMSKGVKLAGDRDELLRHARTLSASPIRLKDSLRETARTYKHPNYRKESVHRHKFIVQPFIPGLTHDYKVLVYADHYYVLKRNVRKNDFRSSGSGLFEFTRTLPESLLPFSEQVLKTFDVPNISLDIAVIDSIPYLLEMQFVAYGNKTLEWSEFHFVKEDEGWEISEGKSCLEEIYAQSIAVHLTRKTAMP